MPVYALDERIPRLPPADRHWIAPDATVLGNVLLEDEVSVWFRAVIRGDNELIRLGERCNIQDGCILHTDPGYPMTLGPDCTVGHGAVLHGCTVGAASLVGMGAVVLNGASIGTGCLIGAKTFIPEGREIPDNSLVVGSPGRVVRKLGEADRVRLLATAAHYVRNWRRFADGLAPAADIAAGTGSA